MTTLWWRGHESALLAPAVCLEMVSAPRLGMVDCSAYYRNVAHADWALDVRQFKSSLPDLAFHLNVDLTLRQVRHTGAVMDENQAWPLKLDAICALIDAREGWLSYLDAELLHFFLHAQREVCAASGVLEIGVYAGKSAIVLASALRKDEAFILCDPLIDTLHTPLAPGIPSLRDTADWLTMQINGLRIRAVESPSIELVSRLDSADQHFRAIHIDGDHSEIAVRADLAYASATVARDGGLVVVDDYRAAHTPGVAAAFWPWFAELDEVHCLVLSESKAYVLLGGEWNGVVRRLPGSLSHGILASEENLFRCQVVRYANARRDRL